MYIPGNCQNKKELYGYMPPKQLEILKFGIPIVLFALGMYNCL